MKQNYNLSTFETAANLIESGKLNYSCLAIGQATIGAGRGFETRELKLFQEIFELLSEDGYANITFGRLNTKAFPDEYFPSHDDLLETRILALCFAYEIARRKNRQGGHAARSKKRAEKRKQKALEDLAKKELANLPENPMVDLMTCKPGDKLLSKHGLILTYTGYCPW
jgi:hypothetical protein